MDTIIPTRERIGEIRKEQECSIYHAKREALREAVHAAINDASGMDDIKRILRTIVEHWHLPAS
jgi:hypothetical protein